MRALVYTAPRQLIVEDWPRPRPAAGEVEIAVDAAGICGADISGFLGRSRRRTPPLIFGHELVGRTADGRRVVADPLIGCGRCVECLRGAKNLCSGLRLLGMDPMSGCFAEYVAVPAPQVYEIPDELDDARAVYAEPLANIVHLFRLAAPQPRFRMGIVGVGTMGSMALKMALYLGADEVLVEDVDELRLAAARQMGATLAVNPARIQNADSTKQEVILEFEGLPPIEQKALDGWGTDSLSADRLRRLTTEEDLGGTSAAGSGLDLFGLDLVLDACGTEAARQRAFRLCRPGGTVVLLGMAQERSELDFGASIRREHRVLMSFGYTTDDFRRSLELLSAGEIDLTAWTAEMPLEEGQRAFERMSGSRGGTLKMVLRVRG